MACQNNLSKGELKDRNLPPVGSSEITGKHSCLAASFFNFPVPFSKRQTAIPGETKESQRASDAEVKKEKQEDRQDNEAQILAR